MTERKRAPRGSLTPEQRREKKRLYDATPEARAAKARRRATPKYQAKAKEYNTSWWSENGRAWNHRPGAKAVRKKWRQSEKGKVALRAKSKRFASTPYGRSQRLALQRAREARQLGQTCGCCESWVFKNIYAAARVLDCEVDHIKALGLGGLHCRHNLQLLTPAEHKKKTASDLAAIAKFKRAASG